LLIVSNGTRKARAISSVERPPSVRSVSPTCASSASAGWQQVKISSSRSSAKVAELLQLRGEGECAVEVLSLDQDQAGEKLLAVNERAVGQEHLSRLEPEGRRRLGRLQTEPAAHIGVL